MFASVRKVFLQKVTKKTKAVEKALKANLVFANENKNPPRIHNLVKLAELSFINLTDLENLFLDEVNDFNIATRYPDFKQAFYKICTKDYAEEYFVRIKEFYKWIGTDNDKSTPLLNILFFCRPDGTEKRV